MRLNVIDRIAEDLRRFRVVPRWLGYEIIDTKGAARFNGYDRVRDVSGAARFFRNRGRAEKVADKLEAEHLAAVKTDAGDSEVATKGHS